MGERQENGKREKADVRNKERKKKEQKERRRERRI